MKYLLSLAVLGIMGCAIPEHRKVYVELQNQSMEPMTIKASLGSFSNTITVAPGSTWKGWVLDQWLVKDVIKIGFSKPFSLVVPSNPRK